MASATMDHFISPSRKRSHDGELVGAAADSTNVGATAIATANDTADLHRTREVSEAPSTMSSLTELTSITVASPTKSKSSSTLPTDESTPATKKRKLTFAEREVEKAVQNRVKEEAKAKREEEKRLRDEDKRRKEEEREIAKRAKELEKAEKKKAEDAKKLEKEEKKKADEAKRIEREEKKKVLEQEKEAEKALKEAEKAQKEAEKLRKERSQMRLGAFFARPTPVSTPPLTPDEQAVNTLSRRSSVASIDIPQDEQTTSSSKPTNPEYENYIIPYFLHDHTHLAPCNRWLAHKQVSSFEGQTSNYQIEHGLVNPEPLQSRFGKRQRGVGKVVSVKTIMEEYHTPEDESEDVSDATELLHSISYKFLSFREDVRPPYMGTYTKQVSAQSARKMTRNPTYRGRPDTNYDYDSEAEWEPPADDDEELGEDEMSDEEEGEADMEDFLDDDNDIDRKKLFVGDMEPVSTGICWQGQTSSSNGFNLEEYQMDFLHDSTTFPIDPFSTVHWADETRASVTAKADTKAAKAEPETSMPPPRVPLATVNVPNNIMNILSPYRSRQDSMSNEKTDTDSPKPAKLRGRPPTNNNTSPKLVAPEFMDSFKQAVEGSDLTKAGLIEILKKQFPKCSKDAIKDTLGAVAERVGKKEVDKRWALKA